ncbi:MAG: cation transporter [Azonexus sp.]|nr:cation transporter [Azonexus sp.]MBP9228365.1 cation transporter [Azonexus sp.]
MLLAIAQVIVGRLANSQSLVAHGLQSFSNLLSDFLVIHAARQSAHPADAAHTCGHARVDTAATLILGASLILIGGGILCESGLLSGGADEFHDPAHGCWAGLGRARGTDRYRARRGAGGGGPGDPAGNGRGAWSA